jgi:hypothetical protein
VVPAFLIGGSSTDYNICDTSSGGQWKRSEPWAEIVHVKEADKRSKGNAVNLIKMAKIWQRNCNVPLKSFALELLAIEALSASTWFDKSTVYYDWIVRDFFNHIRSRGSSWVTVPGTGEMLFLSDNWVSRAESAYQRAVRACDDESNGYPASAHSEWVKIFGDGFPW